MRDPWDVQGPLEPPPGRGNPDLPRDGKGPVRLRLEQAHHNTEGDASGAQGSPFGRAAGRVTQSERGIRPFRQGEGQGWEPRPSEGAQPEQVPLVRVHLRQRVLPRGRQAVPREDDEGRRRGPLQVQPGHQRGREELHHREEEEPLVRAHSLRDPGPRDHMVRPGQAGSRPRPRIDRQGHPVRRHGVQARQV